MVVPGEENQAYSFISADSPSDVFEDETELPEVNELAQENVKNNFSGE